MFNFGGVGTIVTSFGLFNVTLPHVIDSTFVILHVQYFRIPCGMYILCDGFLRWGTIIQNPQILHLFPSKNHQGRFPKRAGTWSRGFFFGPEKTWKTSSSCIDDRGIADRSPAWSPLAWRSKEPSLMAFRRSGCGFEGSSLVGPPMHEKGFGKFRHVRVWTVLGLHMVLVFEVLFFRTQKFGGVFLFGLGRANVPVTVPLQASFSLQETPRPQLGC